MENLQKKRHIPRKNSDVNVLENAEVSVVPKKRRPSRKVRSSEQKMGGNQGPQRKDLQEVDFRQITG